MREHGKMEQILERVGARTCDVCKEGWRKLDHMVRDCKELKEGKVYKRK